MGLVTALLSNPGRSCANDDALDGVYGCSLLGSNDDPPGSGDDTLLHCVLSRLYWVDNALSNCVPDVSVHV